jgi:superfamily I DNA and RNA helicase
MSRIKVKTIINDVKQENIQFKFGDKVVNLDKFQNKVITSDTTKNLRIIACAGSGKTTTILCKIKYMIDNLKINQKRILLTTFNIDAANILKDRLKLLLNKNPEVRIGTFDAISAHFYFKYFKQDGFVGVNEYSTLLLNYLNSDSGKTILDLYDYVFFDEFQDINNIQFEIIKKFVENGSKLIAIGDDAQNIYQWRGSNISYILNFDKIFQNTITIKLENNYRSSPEIINFATNIIKNNLDQIDKKMLPNNPSNNLPYIKKYKNNIEQAQDIINQINKMIHDKIKLDELVIISRNNFGLKLFEEQLELYNRDNPDKKRIEYIALITDNDKNITKSYENKLCLATIHKIKGCEWKYVFLIDLDDKIFPSDCDDIGIQEERRLLYVAITRAKLFIQISFTSNTISRFIQEIDSKLYNFPEFKKIYFEINNKRSNQIKTKVTELIQLLNNEDYENIRKQDILSTFMPKEIQIHNTNTYNKEILDNNLQADYGIYIDTYISRMFGLKNIKSNGLENLTAKCTIYSIELSAQQYNIYLESKLPIQLLMYEYDIIKMYHSVFDLDEYKMNILENILNKIIAKAKYLKVYPSYIYVTKSGFLPNEFESMMISSYNNYILSKQIDNKDIYNISLCQNVYLNRKRLLYRDCYAMFDKEKKIYDDINIFCDKYYKNKIEIKKTIIDNDRLISGELDMYDETEKKIIDFKTSLNKHIQIEWILQLLTYASLIKTKTKLPVDYISIYNPISGLEYIIDIKNWFKEKELLDYLKKVRDEKDIKKNIKEVKQVDKKEVFSKLPKKKYKEKRDILIDSLDLDDELKEEYNKLRNKIN